MYLERISLLNFKNYESLELNLSPEINCFVGENGSGKTNLLDAIHYLSLSKSAFNKTDTQNIKHGESFFALNGWFTDAGEVQQVHCSLKLGDKKVVKLNKSVYERISDHIGRFPVVLIAPDDTDVIKEGSEERRKFFDQIISQIDRPYLETLMKYNHYLLQRNSLLKQFYERSYFDQSLLDAYTEPLLQLGQQVYERRKAFIEHFSPIFVEHYQNLTESREEVTLMYASHWHEDNFEQQFREAVKKDVYAQRTSLGVHKDDYVFNINGFGLKKFGSQGQQKSYVIALKLAQFDVIYEEKEYKPLLLLDDIFDKLDDRRIARLLEMVAGHQFGQIFITDARPERTGRLLQHIEAQINIYKTNAEQNNR
jgi:DNA replication and repair protein RecF